MYSLLDGLFMSAFRMLAGTPAFEKLCMAADWLYPLNRPQTQRSRRTRLYLRSLLSYRATAQWLNYLWADEALLSWVQRNPELIEKIHRPYLSKDFHAAERVALLQSHYQLLSQHPLGHLLYAVSRQDMKLAEFTGKAGGHYVLRLGVAPQSLQKEGELTLRIDGDGLYLQRLTFAFSAHQGQRRLMMGCLQGNPDAASRDKIRDATKEMHGLRPRNLLLLAAQSIASAYGVQSIVGVSDKQHIYRHWRKRREIMQSYDGMWSDLGGAMGANGMFELPLQHEQKPLNAYPSNKRSSIARRQVLENDITQSIWKSLTVEPVAA